LTELLVHVGDMHTGSSVALCPERVELSDGGTYLASPLQLFYLECWRRFWADTARLKRQLKARCVVIFGGDERDGDHHRTTQLFCADELDQDRAVMRILAHAEDVADEWVFVRGTPAHCGPNSAGTERYAEAGAKAGWNVRMNGNQYSWWAYTGEHEGVKVEVAHAPGTKSWVPTTRGVACARHAQYTRSEYHESGEVPPDIVVRHHVHYWSGPGCDSGTCCFFIPAWQAPTSFVRSIGVKSAASSHFVPGGLRIACADGAWHPYWKRFRPPSGVAWSKKK
jgi:hypothetical protein